MKLLVSDAGTRPNSIIQIQYRPLPLAVQPAALLPYLRQTEGDILRLCVSINQGGGHGSEKLTFYSNPFSVPSLIAAV